MAVTDQVALVTGASRGIGSAIAVALAEAGADVALNYFPASSEGEQVAARIEAIGRKALLCPGDVANYDVVEQIVEQVNQHLGPVDIGIANAAFHERDLFHQADLADFRRSVDVTMWGAFHLFRAAARQMIKRASGGVLIAISSPHAYTPLPRAMAYNMAKAAVDQMARTAAVELLDHRIRVNIVYPGWTDTPGERKYLSDDELAAAATKLPWRRLARPEEVARAVLFLCDSDSDYLTGSSILVDGGHSLRRSI